MSKEIVGDISTAKPWQRAAKRTIDLIVASSAMVVTAPLVGFAAAAIKLEDGGPIFYVSPRIGENGRKFHMFKIRSMIHEPERILVVDDYVTHPGTNSHKYRNDPRVTRTGRILRRFSIDEIPQFLNVLLGNMSLVGPRPEIPTVVASYEPWQYTRLSVPQGMTGWWQVNGRSENVMHLNTRFDLYYIENFSLLLDIKILCRTAFVVLRGKGAF